MRVCSIVLFNTFRNFNNGGEDASIQHALLSFVSISVGSCIMGVTLGLLCCMLFKYTQFNDVNHDHEFSVIIFFSYASYCLAEIVGLSGIMAIFFNAIILSHYNSYNLSPGTYACRHSYVCMHRRYDAY